MVKLIRLTTTDNKAVFDNIFNEDIIIPQNSKIALQSMTAEIDTNEIIIDGLSNKITYSIVENSPNKVIYLNKGTYNSTNFAELLLDATKKMNNELKNITNELGLQWQVCVNKDKKISFYIKRGDFIMPEKQEYYNKYGSLNVAIPNSGTTFGPSGGIVGLWDSFMFFKTPNSKGASTYRCKIVSTPANTTPTDYDQGFLLGYSNTVLFETATINYSTIQYGIHCVAVGSNYRKIINGIDTATNAVAEVGDVLALDIENSTIKYHIYRGTEDKPITLYEQAIDMSVDLYPLMVFLSDCKVSYIRFTDEPIFDDAPSTIEIDDETISAVPKGGSVQSIKTLTFSSPDLAIIFGYTQTSITSPKTDSYNFESTNFFNMADFADSFVIELLDIPLDSYDGSSNQRRNILATIVQTDSIRERLTYSAHFPIYLDIRNAQTLTQRRLRARILREDLSSVAIVGIAQITLLIDHSQ